MLRILKTNEGQIGAVILLFQLWLIFITALDHLVHDTLYDFGLQFSYEWADPYWILLSLIWTTTVILAVYSYWIGRNRNMRNKITAFRIGFTFFGEWIGSFLDTLFFVLKGRIPAENRMWWWNPYHRFFGVPWHTSTQYAYNMVWAVIIVAVWAITRQVGMRTKVLSINEQKKNGGNMSVTATEKDYRALITIILLILTGITCLYGMFLGWTTTEILAILAFFGPMDTAAITYYFVRKQIERANL